MPSSVLACMFFGSAASAARKGAIAAWNLPSLKRAKPRLSWIPVSFGFNVRAFRYAITASSYFCCLDKTTPRLANAAASREFCAVIARHALVASASLPCCSRAFASDGVVCAWARASQSRAIRHIETRSFIERLQRSAYRSDHRRPARRTEHQEKTRLAPTRRACEGVPYKQTRRSPWLRVGGCGHHWHW